MRVSREDLAVLAWRMLGARSDRVKDEAGASVEVRISVWICLPGFLCLRMGEQARISKAKLKRGDGDRASSWYYVGRPVVRNRSSTLVHAKSNVHQRAPASGGYEVFRASTEGFHSSTLALI